jgi:hypothetical protein
MLTDFNIHILDPLRVLPENYISAAYEKPVVRTSILIKRSL